jgi:hypothetical protein
MANTDSSKRIESLLQLGNIFFVIGVYLYFIGWIYNYWFLRYFGISQQSIDVQFYHVFVYSYSAIFTPSALFSLPGLILCITILCIIFLSIYFSPKFKTLFILILLIFLIPAAYLLAKQQGTLAAKEIQKHTTKIIIFYFKKDLIKNYPKTFVYANDNKKLRIVATTKDRFYVIDQFDKEGKSAGFIYDIPRADVLLAKVILTEDKIE